MCIADDSLLILNTDVTKFGVRTILLMFLKDSHAHEDYFIWLKYSQICNIVK